MADVDAVSATVSVERGAEMLGFANGIIAAIKTDLLVIRIYIGKAQFMAGMRHAWRLSISIM